MRRDPKVTSAIMRTIKSKGTKIELLFAKVLRKRGVRYRRHYYIKGKPDFVILRHKIAVFVDGDFWHGHGWKLRGFKRLEDSIKHNRKFWINKIRTNVARDRKVNQILTNKGWKVIRLWESNIKKDINKSVAKVTKFID